MNCSIGSRLPLGCLLGIVVWTAAPSPVQAAGESCYRDTECAGQESCIEQTCAEDIELAPCTNDDACEGQDVCVDGFCKAEGVVCRSVAGACWLRDAGGECRCADGNESGWSDGYNPDDPPEPSTDAELEVRCTEELADTCGTEAPSLPDSCVGDVLAECSTYVEHLDTLLELCGEDVPEVNIARVGECCETFDIPHYAAYRACLLDIEAGDSCPGDAWGACEGQGGSNEGDGEHAGGTADDDEASSKAGCRIAARPPLWAFLLLVGCVVRLRRPRG